MNEIIKIEGLRKRFGDNEVLKGITTSVKQGEVVAIIGPSGCGKSTFLRSINLLEEPTEGKILIDGIDLTSWDVDINKMRQRVGMVFQQFNLFPNMTIRRNIMLAPVELGKMTREEADEKATELLSRIGLLDKADCYPDSLSGGQKQRVAIARALALEPEILILDEATSALDVSVQQTIIELIVKLQKEKNITIGFICHDISLIQSCAHEVAVMYLGNVVEVLPAKNLSEHAVHPYTRALIGSIFDIGMDFGKPIEEIKGEAPSPLDVPAGCPFRGRCPKATEKCAAEKPKLHQIGADHEVACHLFDKEDK